MCMIDIIFFPCDDIEKVYESLYSVSSQSFKEWRCFICGEIDGDFSNKNNILSDERFIFPDEDKFNFCNAQLSQFKFLKGKYTALMHGGDIWLTYKLELQVEVLERNSSYSLVGANAILGDDDFWSFSMPRVFPPGELGEVSAARLVDKAYLLFSSLLVKREFLDEHIRNCDLKHIFNWLLVLSCIGDSVFIIPKPLFVTCRAFQKKMLGKNIEHYDFLLKYFKSDSDIVSKSILKILHGQKLLLSQKKAMSRCYLWFYNQCLVYGITGGIISILKLCKTFIKNKVLKFFINFFKKQNMTLILFPDYVKSVYANRIVSMIGRKTFSALKNNEERKKCGVGCIIFSKDRPLQFHALLISLIKRFERLPEKIVILYNVSNEKYQKAYDEIIKEFASFKEISFIKENGGQFKKDLLDVLYNIDHEKIFFLVDDIIITDDVELSFIDDIDFNKYIFSLRLGANIKRSYNKDEKLPLPVFTPFSTEVLKLNSWFWAQGMSYWGYPISVDGHFFLTNEIIAMTETIDFKAPNSFEGKLQCFDKLFSFRKGLCFSKSKLLNIPCNKVQNEIDNKSGNTPPEKLLEYWNKGYRVDIDKFYGIYNDSAHKELNLELYRKN